MVRSYIVEAMFDKCYDLMLLKDLLLFKNIRVSMSVGIPYTEKKNQFP